jgi:hypothetical protein
MPAPKGNKNALKHGLYAEKASAMEVLAPSGVLTAGERGEALRGPAAVPAPHGAGMRNGDLRSPSATIRYLEYVMDEIYARLKRAQGEDFTRLANALSLAATALFNGHRTVAFLTGGISPVDDALRELEALGFDED